MDRTKIVRDYLQQQQDQQYIDHLLGADFSNPGLMKNIPDAENENDDDADEVVEAIDEAILEQFKMNVKKWMDLDKEIKRLQAAVKVRKGLQQELNDKILDFMSVHNIEDLNTKEGILRYKSGVVTRQLPQKEVRKKLFEKFQSDPKTLDSIKQVFEERKKCELSKLKRIKF